jgi:dienelactone hydrolase
MRRPLPVGADRGGPLNVSADPRIRAAISHWAPRLIANGIDYNDFQTTTARIEHWGQWCAEWSKTARKHEMFAEKAEQRGSPVSAAEAWVRAAICHHFGKFVFFDDMDQYRAANAATIANYQKALPWMSPAAERVPVPYNGAVLHGYLRRPDNAERPPVVIVICGLDSVKEEMHFFESDFHRVGLATLTVDGPGQGEGEHLPIEPAYEKVVAASIDWLGGQPSLDHGRVAAVGVSLGGYYAARAAAFEPRLTCAVSIGGPYDFGAEFDNVPQLTKQALQVRSHSADLETAKRRASELTLEGAARRIEMPFLIIFGKEDRLIPFQQAERLYAEIPAAGKRLQLYADGNHVCNNMPFAYRPLVRDWVASHLASRHA